MTIYMERGTFYAAGRIQSCRDERTKELFETGNSRHWASVQAIALRKLDQIEAAHDLKSLRTPPANRLQALKDDRAGQHCNSDQ